MVRAAIDSRSSTNHSCHSKPAPTPPSTASARTTTSVETVLRVAEHGVVHERGVCRIPTPGQVLVDQEEGGLAVAGVRVARSGSPRRPPGDEPLLAVDAPAVVNPTGGGRMAPQSQPASASVTATRRAARPGSPAAGSAPAARPCRTRGVRRPPAPKSHSALVALPSCSCTISCSTPESPAPPHSPGMLMAHRPASRAGLLGGSSLHGLVRAGPPTTRTASSCAYSNRVYASPQARSCSAVWLGGVGEFHSASPPVGGAGDRPRLEPDRTLRGRASTGLISSSASSGWAAATADQHRATSAARASRSTGGPPARTTSAAAPRRSAASSAAVVGTPPDRARTRRRRGPR